MNKPSLETNPVKILRLKCLDCCCGSSKEVQLCPARDCPCWPWRFGKNPYRKKKELSVEESAALAARLAKGRNSQKSLASL